MHSLIVAPMQEELGILRAVFEAVTPRARQRRIGRLTVTEFPDLALSLAQGGLGKVQFAVQTQHLIDHGPGYDLVLCAGAAGALSDQVAIGDVVIGTETIEHDYHNLFSDRPLPSFPGSSQILETVRRLDIARDFQIHFAPIASGDEDIVSQDRRTALHLATGAIAVAWEGAGGAKACRFNEIPFLEIRGITDTADPDAADSFDRHLTVALEHVAQLILGLTSAIAS